MQHPIAETPIAGPEHSIHGGVKLSSQEFVLQPSGRMQIAIHGRVIARASSPSNDELLGRSHSITIYETTQGEIVASLQFRSMVETELDFCLVERKLNVPETLELLACQDPTEHIDRSSLSEQALGATGSSDLARLSQVIVEDYDSLGREIRSQLQNFVPCDPPQPRLVEQAEVKAGLSGWDPFGLSDRSTT